MKILIFNPYYPPHIGGLESHADELNKHMSKRGFEITVFTPRIPRRAPEYEVKFDNVSIIRFPAFEIISNYPLPKFWNVHFWSVFAFIWKQKYDVVVSRTRFFNTSLLALIYSKLQRVKWVHIEHGSDFVQLSNPLKSIIAKLYDLTLGRLVFIMSDKNIAISEAVQKFIKRFDPRDTPVIYRSIEANRIDAIPADENMRKKFKNKLIILTVGRLYKWKGTNYAIEAVNSLPNDLKSNVVFFVIGDGEDYERISRLAAYPVIILGSLPWEETLSIMKAADVYIHPSMRGGGLSTSLLEAMYCNCAVIGTPEEGAGEVIANRHNGLLVNPKDPAAIRKNIITLSQDKILKERMAREGRKTINTMFSWNQTVEEYSAIFSNIRTL